MNITKNIIGLFPTPVGEFIYDKDLTEKERLFLLNQEQVPNEGNTTSKKRNLLHDAELVEFKTFIDACVQEYFKTVYAPKFDVKLEITQSWTNYTEPGQFHHKHEHPNSFVSGTFYVNADPEKDKIYFYNQKYRQIKIETESWNAFNSESWWLPAKTNTLFLFPSHLTHMVETVSANETRVSLAFNTFPKGYVGNDDSLTGLHL